MKRRDFVTGLALIAAAEVAHGAPPRYRVGVLSARFDHWDEGGAIRQELRSLGLAEGKDLAFVVRYPRGDPARFGEFARELVALKVDAILTGTTVGTRAALDATRSIPIVTYVGDAVASGIAASYASSGRNVTGLSQAAREELSKRLELMRVLVPRMRELVAFLHPVVAPALTGLYESASREFGMPVRIVIVESPDDVIRWLGALPRGQAPPGFIIDRLESPAVARHARAAGMALGGHTSRWVEQGGLLQYALYHRNSERRIATLLAAVLRGADPSTLPFELPDSEELVINRAAARAIGLVLPAQILLRARIVDE